jgi:HEPN domain-containing protein
MEHAGEDLEAAKVLLGPDDLLDAAAFHCQQCIEKALKGYLLFTTNNPVDGHNLTWLCRQAVKRDTRFQEWLDESAALNHFYIETRYPSDIPLELSKASVITLFQMAKSMYVFICGEMGITPVNGARP